VSACVVFITTPPGAVGQKLAGKIVTARLAACVNIVPQVQSIYWWQGKRQNDRESLLIVKTRKALVKKLISFVRKNHPYTVPEVIALDIKAGHRPYLSWLEKETCVR
jgi:periplasmic divalent cation tolerance protein